MLSPKHPQSTLIPLINNDVRASINISIITVTSIKEPMYRTLRTMNSPIIISKGGSAIVNMATQGSLMME